MFYPLAHHIWGKAEENAINEVLKSTQITMGLKVKEFERRFASYFGVKHAIMVTSGSTANLIAIAALIWQGKLKRGDEVIVPAIGWSTTYAPLVQNDLKLIVVDVEPETLTIDVERAKRAITPRTRMVMGLSILGNPCNLVALSELCNKKGLILFEDNCESIGARLWNSGQYTGTVGEVGTFSFFHTHQISTGEGGVIVTDNLDLADRIRSLRAYGWTRPLSNGSLLRPPQSKDFAEEYCFIYPGYNAKPMEIQAAVGIVQLGKLPKFIQRRRMNAEIFGNHFLTQKWGRGADIQIQIQKEKYGASSWFGFTLVPNKKGLRAKILPALREAGIEFRLITGGNFLMHPAKKHYMVSHGKTPVADHVHNEGLFVGNSSTKSYVTQIMTLDETVYTALR